MPGRLGPATDDVMGTLVEQAVEQAEDGTNDVWRRCWRRPDVKGRLAREAGFRVPVAPTAAAWEDCVAWSADDSRRQTPQDETGRLWDVLNMTGFAIRRSGGSGDRVTVELYRVPRDGKVRQPRRVQLTARSGPATTPSRS